MKNYPKTKCNYKESNELLTLSAYATDYNDLCYRVKYDHKKWDYLPKSECKLIKGHLSYTQLSPCWFTIPRWLYRRLKGKDRYCLQ